MSNLAPKKHTRSQVPVFLLSLSRAFSTGGTLVLGRGGIVKGRNAAVFPVVRTGAFRFLLFCFVPTFRSQSFRYHRLAGRGRVGGPSVSSRRNVLMACPTAWAACSRRRNGEYKGNSKKRGISRTFHLSRRRCVQMYSVEINKCCFN